MPARAASNSPHYDEPDPNNDWQPIKPGLVCYRTVAPLKDSVSLSAKSHWIAS